MMSSFVFALFFKHEHMHIIDWDQGLNWMVYILRLNWTLAVMLIFSKSKWLVMTNLLGEIFDIFVYIQQCGRAQPF